MNDEQIEFEFQLSEKEYVDGVKKITFSQRVMTVSIAIFVFLMIFQISAFVEDGDFSSTSPIIFIFPVLWLFMLVITPRTTKKQYRSNSRVREKVRYEVDKSMIRVLAETYSCDLSVDKIFKTSETDTLLLIYENKRQAHIIPKRAIGTNQLQQLKDIIKQS